MASKSVVLFVILVSFAAIALAADCGGSVPCSCGDNLVQDTVLSYDLTGCAGNGLTLGAENITLDCAGHSISGSGQYGVRVSGKSGTTIKNCRVFGFSEAGISLYYGSNYANVTNNTLSNFTLGVYASFSNGSLVYGNNLDTGLHGVVLSASNGNTVKNNSFYNIQQATDIYGSNGNTIMKNRFQGGGTGVFLSDAQENQILENVLLSQQFNGILFDMSSNNLVHANTVRFLVGTAWSSGAIRIIGDSNVFSDNIVSDNANSGFKIEYSHGNVLVNNTATNNSVSGFSLSYSSNNLLVNNTANDNLDNIGLNYGFYLNHNADGNYLFNNTANRNQYGFYIWTSNNQIFDNIAQENTEYDLFVSNEYPELCINTIERNTGSGGRLIKFVNSQTVLQNQVFSELLLCNASNSVLTNISVLGSDTLNNNGIFVTRTDNSVFSGIVSRNNLEGMALVMANNNQVRSSTFRDNRGTGFGLYMNSRGNLVSRNTIDNNDYDGFVLSDSGGNTITGNTVSNNHQNGFVLYAGSGNSSGNLFENNTIANNAVNAYEYSNGNLWNSTIGNYWSDFANNSGYPNYYVIAGPGDGIDWHPVGAGYNYTPGDANGDRSVNGIDVTFLVSYFKGGAAPPFYVNTAGGRFYPAADANGDCKNQGSDVTYLVNYLKGGPAPRYCPNYPPLNQGNVVKSSVKG